MKLVNIVQRQRYKKDLESFIKRLAPELLNSQNYKAAIEKMVNYGLISPGEKAYFDIRLQAKMIILMMEQLLEEHGIDAVGSIAFIDKDYKKPGSFGKVVHLSGPHMPEEYINAIDGKDFTPFFGVCGKSVAKNQVVVCLDVENEPTFQNCGFMEVYRKYHFHTVAAFPIRVDGEVIGTLSLFSTQKFIPSKHTTEQLKTKLYDLENVFASIQESWKNRNIMSYKAIIHDHRIYYNEETCVDALGYEAAEMLNKHIFEDFVHEDDVWEVKEKLSYLEEHLTSVRNVQRVKRKDGSYAIQEILFIPITGDHGLRYIEAFISTNTKACHEFEEELSQMNRKNYSFN